MLTKTTKVYADHGIPLECDIYEAEDHPDNGPVMLYFHPGGLVDWGRDCLAPWLVQVCQERKWPLVSPSYRLLPQVGAAGLLDDVTAAYEFARSWRAEDNNLRQVIVSGASGGFFTAALVAHHCQPKPLALLSIEGINTFRHPFFNSSTLLTPEPLDDDAMAAFTAAGPAVVGVTPTGARSTFRLDKLRPDGSKNPDYVYPPPPAPASEGPGKGALYDYFIHKNAWLDIVGEVDRGYEWAKEDRDEAARWPPTVVFHGDQDEDVPIAVSEQMRDCLGTDRVSLFVAEGQPHLFELTRFIDDDLPEMEAVRKAVTRLDDILRDTEVGKA